MRSGAGIGFTVWTHETDKANYLGPVIWSEADCVLRFALELEKEFPNQVHCLDDWLAEQPSAVGMETFVLSRRNDVRMDGQ